jgi:hypothetical protein
MERQICCPEGFIASARRIFEPEDENQPTPGTKTVFRSRYGILMDAAIGLSGLRAARYIRTPSSSAM